MKRRKCPCLVYASFGKCLITFACDFVFSSERCQKLLMITVAEL
jgi:hypothetical protein